MEDRGATWAPWAWPRAVLAAALLAGLSLWTQHRISGEVPLVMVIAVAVLAIGLAFRRPWARAFLLGHAAWYLGLFTLLAWQDRPAAWIVALACLYGVAVGLLAPWRRRELDRRGWGLVVIGFAFAGARVFGFSNSPLTDMAVLSLGLAGIGVANRARWAPALAIVGALAQFTSLTEWLYKSDFATDQLRFMIWTCLNVPAALIGAFLSWDRTKRSARSSDGPVDVLPDMRRRWMLLFAAGMTCLVARYSIVGSFDALREGGIPVIGMCVITAIGAVCATANAQQRWPAWVALVAALPVLGHYRRFLPFLAEWLERTGASGVVLLTAAASLPVVALYVALRKAPRDQPLRAVARPTA